VTSLRQLAGELTTEITMVSEVIAGLLAGDRGYQIIQQLPGIGPVLAAVIVAEIGDATRFRSAAQLCSWAGLTPRHRESDTKVTRGHITKQGSRLLRWALIEAIQHAPAGSLPGATKAAIIARQASQAHRQGRCRPPPAHPGLLRDARRADPLPGPAPRQPTARAGSMTSPGQRPGARPPVTQRHRRSAGPRVSVIDPA
jgi:hypothetical protein